MANYMKGGEYEDNPVPEVTRFPRPYEVFKPPPEEESMSVDEFNTHFS